MTLIERLKKEPIEVFVQLGLCTSPLWWKAEFISLNKNSVLVKVHNRQHLCVPLSLVRIRESSTKEDFAKFFERDWDFLKDTARKLGNRHPEINPVEINDMEKIIYLNKNVSINPGSYEDSVFYDIPIIREMPCWDVTFWDVAVGSNNEVEGIEDSIVFQNKDAANVLAEAAATVFRSIAEKEIEKIIFNSLFGEIKCDFANMN